MNYQKRIERLEAIIKPVNFSPIPPIKYRLTHKEWEWALKSSPINNVHDGEYMP